MNSHVLTASLDAPASRWTGRPRAVAVIQAG